MYLNFYFHHAIIGTSARALMLYSQYTFIKQRS